MRTVLLSAIAVLAMVGGAAAHPGHGAGGPPSTVTMGPPAAVNHVPNGNDNGIGQAASLLGDLNAAHASSTALEHASSNSIVGAIALYKAAMMKALADLKAAQQANDQNAINAANAEIMAAENALALRANKPLTPQVIAQLNALLGL